MITTKEKEIQGHRYQVTQFGARKGLQVAVQLIKMLSPVVKGVVGKGKTVNDMLNAEIAVGDIVESLASQLDQESTVQLIMTLLSTTHRDGMDLSSEVNFNSAYAGCYGELIPAITFVLEVNYSDFFGMLAGGTGNLSASIGKAEKA